MNGPLAGSAAGSCVAARVRPGVLRGSAWARQSAGQIAGLGPIDAAGVIHAASNVDETSDIPFIAMFD